MSKEKSKQLKSHNKQSYQFHKRFQPQCISNDDDFLDALKMCYNEYLETERRNFNIQLLTFLQFSIKYSNAYQITDQEYFWEEVDVIEQEYENHMKQGSEQSDFEEEQLDFLEYRHDFVESSDPKINQRNKRRNQRERIRISASLKTLKRVYQSSSIPAKNVKSKKVKVKVKNTTNKNIYPKTEKQLKKQVYNQRWQEKNKEDYNKKRRDSRLKSKTLLENSIQALQSIEFNQEYYQGKNQNILRIQKCLEQGQSITEFTDPCFKEDTDCGVWIQSCLFTKITQDQIASVISMLEQISFI